MFKGRTILERVNANTYKLNSTLSFTTNNLCVKVKRGLPTDGASITKLAWSIIGSPFNSKYVGSAIIHDGLYASNLVTRAHADRIFLEMLKHNGVGLIKRKVMYHMVKLFGGLAYKRSPEEIEASSKFVEVKLL